VSKDAKPAQQQRIDQFFSGPAGRNSTELREGGVAGARSHSGPCREAAVEIQSSVPWIGFPVGYAVSGILLTVFGYFAMLLAQ
jgi:hypothetical protein